MFSELAKDEDRILRRRREREEGFKRKDAQKQQNIQNKSYSTDHLKVRQFEPFLCTWLGTPLHSCYRF